MAERTLFDIWADISYLHYQWSQALITDEKYREEFIPLLSELKKMTERGKIMEPFRCPELRVKMVGDEAWYYCDMEDTLCPVEYCGHTCQVLDGAREEADLCP